MSSSRFVSAGGIEQASEKDDAWKKAQEAVEATKKQKEEAAAGSGLQEGGKTLFDVLQANKAAKQEAFEESLRLKNQVQFLNEEDAEYLESLSKTERAQKAASQKEAREQLAAFRKQQDEAEKAGLAGDQGNPTQEEGETTWAFNARKRKNQKEHEFIKGLKLRKTSSTGKAEAEVAKTAAIDSKRVVLVEKIGDETKDYTSKAHSPAKATQKPSATASGLGLGAYSSDEDD